MHSLRKPSEGHTRIKSLGCGPREIAPPAFLGPVNHLRKTGALLLCRTACAWHGFLACTSVHSSWARKRRLRVSKNSVCTTVRKRNHFGAVLCSYLRVPLPSPPTGRYCCHKYYMPLFRNMDHTLRKAGSARKLSLCHKAFHMAAPSPTSEWGLNRPRIEWQLGHSRRDGNGKGLR